MPYCCYLLYVGPCIIFSEEANKSKREKIHSLCQINRGSHQNVNDNKSHCIKDIMVSNKSAYLKRRGQSIIKMLRIFSRELLLQLLKTVLHIRSCGIVVEWLKNGILRPRKYQLFIINKTHSSNISLEQKVWSKIAYNIENMTSWKLSLILAIFILYCFVWWSIARRYETPVCLRWNVKYPIV